MQNQLPKLVTEPDPDGAGPGFRITRETRYDAPFGRVLGTNVNNGTWTCIAYDQRGRVTSSRDSAGSTTTTTYLADSTTTSFIDSDGLQHNTTQYTDRLGRPTTYVDTRGSGSTTNGWITRTAYDQAGRVAATYRQTIVNGASGAETLLATNAFGGVSDGDGLNQTISTTEYTAGANSPRTTGFEYDAAGRQFRSTLPGPTGAANGLQTKSTFDPNSGASQTLKHTTNGGGTVLSGWTYARSAGGRITHEIGQGRDRAFFYDGAGRLTQANDGGVSRNYAYDKDSNRCAGSSMTTQIASPPVPTRPPTPMTRAAIR